MSKSSSNTPTIKLIIFSKDRAAQLELLLRSIETNIPDLFSPVVIYTSSTRDFKHGYERLRDSYKESVLFVPETNLRKDIITQTNLATNHICYSTDDTVIFKPFGSKNILDIRQDQVFSLRLGLNTVMQDIHTGTYQPALTSYHEDKDILTWQVNRYHPHSNYGYPFALDMHIMPAKLIQSLISEFNWHNPTGLESGLTKYRDKIKYLSSPKYSIAVNIPVNCAGGVTQHGKFFPASLESLNESYLNGNLISLKHIAEQNIIGCHQEIELKYE